MLHENLTRSEEIVGPTNRRFGLTIGAVLAVVGVIRLALGHSGWEWWLAAGLGFALFGVFWPAALAPFNRFWLKLGLLLHKVVNPIVMTLLFATTIVPIGVLMRLGGKDMLGLRPRPDLASYWIKRDTPGSATETMKNQF